MALTEPYKGKSYSIQRYRMPRPRIDLGFALGGVASAAMDVSDGLFQDLEHICSASNVSALLNANEIPLSKEVKIFLEKKKFSIEQVVTGGDDYELIFTASPANQKEILKAARFAKTRVTHIGTIQNGKGVAILDGNGHKIPLKKGGFSHS